MPELPEVTTTVNGLQRVLPSLRISSVWTDLAKKKVSRKDFEHTIKSEKFFNNFKKLVIGAKVLNVERRAKNILINLDSGYTILIHLKMTGHLIYGDYVYNKKVNAWLPHKNERASLHDPYNRFVHVVFTLTSPRPSPGKGEGVKHLVFCDSRKFGKVTLIDTKTAHETTHLKGVGPEPLEKNFSFENFKTQLQKKSNWPIKQSLMDQYTIAGIGNIYSDEMLWLASIHPESKISKIPNLYLKNLFTAMKQVLNKGIDFGGDSMSDYRDINGERGKFQNHHNVYQKKGIVCGKKSCKGVIIRSIVGGRSAHYCPSHQKLFK
jgi:formamidopyrimidine-DNA glycosylase